MVKLKEGLFHANVLSKDEIQADSFYARYFFPDFEGFELKAENIHLRKIEQGDLELYQKLGIQTFTETFAFTTPKPDFASYVEDAYDLKILADDLKDKHSWHFAYFLHDRIPLAYIKINAFDSQTEKMPSDYMEIQRFYCLSVAQGLGLGKGLINLAKDLAQRKGYSTIWLGVWEYNFKAQDFYKRQGFFHHSQHRFIMGEDEQVDYIYKYSVR